MGRPIDTTVPPAVRSCFHDRKKKGLITDYHEAPEYHWTTLEDFNHKLLADSHPAPKSFKIAAVKMNRKLQEAVKGQLRFGRGEKYDVDQMVARPEILELKFSDLPTDCKSTRRWIRVYFAEPLDSRGELRRISIRMKYADRPNEQTEDAIAAFDLLKQGRLA